jgi:hypothetical protein
MKKTMLAAAAFAASLSAIAVSAPAFAQDAQPGSGHYEWRSTPSFGPRAPTAVRTRIWVPDAMQQATRDCAMMHGAAADCMTAGGKPAKG